MKHMTVMHPAAKMVTKDLFLFYVQLVDLSAAQDIEAGDGTTSVVVLAGSLLNASVSFQFYLTGKTIGKGSSSYYDCRIISTRCCQICRVLDGNVYQVGFE